ncbi:hypothetical protein KPSA1_01796 [Pseudomonas syringae pv. actinidiae]|uniref:Uncharacterized protein n=1 Tax=Pseudomonas syringae pv. actinidiae TaxID=103796 RepID=A0A2V0QGS8_PSESF|nr:hypothetical protein KPSA1_01796 [Pseudomonas syringae pv. actinidiae]
MRKLVEKLHTPHQLFSVLALCSVIPTGSEALVQLVLSDLELTLEGRHTGKIGLVLQVLEIFAQLHLLQKKFRIMHGDLKRHLVAIHRQKVARPFRRALQGLIGFVETGRTLQRQTLLTLGSVSEAVRVDVARQFTVARCQLVEIKLKLGLEFEQGKMTGTAHNKKPQTLKLSPQPHSPRELGLLNLKPSFNPSRTKSSSVPSR